MLWSRPSKTEYPHRLGTPSSTFGRSDLQTFRRVSNLSPFFSILSGHSYTTAAHQPFCNQPITHSFHRDGGCTSLCGNYKSWPQIVRGQPLSHNMLWSRRTKTEYPHRLVYPISLPPEAPSRTQIRSATRRRVHLSTSPGEGPRGRPSAPPADSVCAPA